MRCKFLLSVCLLAFGLGQANADTINFSQFGAPGTDLSSPLVGITTDGVAVTITSPSGAFAAFIEAPHVFLGDGTWEGTFPSGAPILLDGTAQNVSGPGTVTLEFATAITSLTLAAQANDFGNFVETMKAFSGGLGGTLVDTEVSGTLFNCANLSCEGTQAFLTLSFAGGFNAVTVSTTNDGDGFALYGGAGATPSETPIPGALPLFVSGLGALGLLARRRKQKQIA
jgi:hypothetical protein